VSGASGRFAFDPFDASQTQEMWPMLAAMRREAPISRPIAGFVYVARYADVKEVFRDARTFSSREGFRGAGVVVPDEECFLGEIDPPAHPKLRELLRQAFRPGFERRSESFTRAFAERKLREIGERRGGDLVSDLGIHLPPAVTAHVLGLPTDDIERVGRWGFELLHSTWPETNRTERGVGLAGAFPEFARFLDEQIALRRRTASPPDDLLTSMVGAAEAGTVLSDVQVRTLAANCLLASQSTANLVGNLLHRFVSDAAFERRLRADRELAPAAIEESLRFEPPVLFLFRTARYDTELSGEKIRAGERVILGIASGNRDEDVYERADEFWIGRWPGAAQHLTFGPGPHLCLGNQLARMEARVVLELVMDLFPEGALRLAPGYRRRHVPMFLEYGPERLDVVIAE
jgi:cytochrome P450